MGTSTRPAPLPFLRHDDLASCRSDFEHHRREGFPVYSLKRDEKRQSFLSFFSPTTQVSSTSRGE
jgi:hypothetical protein